MIFETPYTTDSNGTVIHPDAMEFFGRTVKVGNLLIGEYSGSLNLTPYPGQWPIGARKKAYTGPQFYKALTVAERELLINKSKASDSAGAIFEQIKLLGLDFNDADDVAIIDKMVVAEILISDRRDELVG